MTLEYCTYKYKLAFDWINEHNIPSIKTAFILASSTNPKEYIQRRGRVLRTFPGKRHADIYDFITLPVPLVDDDGLGLVTVPP